MLALDPQIVLDAICSPVGTNNAALFVGWSIGQRKAVASVLADQFGTDAASIDEFISQLIENGLLTNTTKIPSSYSGQNEEHLGITHDGWLKWSYFLPMYVNDWDFGTTEEWLRHGINETRESDCKEVFTMKPTKADKPQVWSKLGEPWSSSMDD